MEKIVFQLSVTEYRFCPSPASLGYVLFFINTKVRLNLMTKVGYRILVIYSRDIKTK